MKFSALATAISAKQSRMGSKPTARGMGQDTGNPLQQPEGPRAAAVGLQGKDLL
ncbi:hypothetical protein PCASD_19306 [Puccinia coronata f. sp. avenae]|uniref:Uncharacterized protein n=1 Tax=Puccinia coronata f. sp. avenae TaxID=200324 RepID=A0A2N5SNQ7_9BASI|nr:hypothetical protein PCASD_19306 [Puccinia coronata f. sp. avenae]